VGIIWAIGVCMSFVVQRREPIFALSYNLYDWNFLISKHRVSHVSTPSEQKANGNAQGAANSEGIPDV